MPTLDQFTPLGKPTERVVCRDNEAAYRMGHPPIEYPDEMNDGSKPVTYREYEMWMLGRKYAHELHLGLLDDNRAMAEAHELAEVTRGRVEGYQRARSWSPENQRTFLDLLAGGASVTETCRIVEMSKQSAYRHRARDKYFAVAWDAALELARPRVLEDFVERAREGQLETWQRIGPEGQTTLVTRRRYDNAHALRLLDRLERGGEDGTVRDDRVADAVADFDGCLAALGTPDAEVRLNPVEPEIDLENLDAETANRLADPLPELGDSGFADALRDLFMVEYAKEDGDDDWDEDEDWDEDADANKTSDAGGSAAADGAGDGASDGDRGVTGHEKVTVAGHPDAPEASGVAPGEATGARDDGTQPPESRLYSDTSSTGTTDHHDEHQGRQG